MQRRLIGCGLMMVLLTLAGCIEQSVVVKVNKDKSAVIQVRHYAEQPSLVIGRSDDGKEVKQVMPTRQQAEAVAKALGEGVTVDSIEESTNSSGWKGYSVVFRCEDINQVVLQAHLITSMTSKKDADEKAANKRGVTTLIDETRFEFDGTNLKLIHPSPSGPSATSQQATQDPFAKAEPVPAVNPIGDALMVGILQRVRLGFFVQVEGNVKETNARHVNGNMVSLFSIDGSKLDAASISKLVRSKPTNPDYAQTMQSMADETEGLEFDFQEMVTVRLDR